MENNTVKSIFKQEIKRARYKIEDEGCMSLNYHNYTTKIYYETIKEEILFTKEVLLPIFKTKDIFINEDTDEKFIIQKVDRNSQGEYIYHIEKIIRDEISKTEKILCDTNIEQINDLCDKNDSLRKTNLEFQRTKSKLICMLKLLQKLPKFKNLKLLGKKFTDMNWYDVDNIISNFEQSKLYWRD